MIVTCPSCETSYFADDTTIAREKGRLTCVACGHTWSEAPTKPSSSDESLTRGAHERYLEAVRLKRQRQSRIVANAMWATTTLIFCGALVAAFVFRNDVVRSWPQAASAYGWVGISVNRFGVDFENIERSRELRGTVPILTVSADIRNITRRPQPAPAVRVGLLDDFGQEIDFLVAPITAEAIPPGGTARFNAVLENPPAESYSLDLRFVDAAGFVAPPQTVARPAPDEGLQE